jgi:hypothetical protein
MLFLAGLKADFISSWKEALQTNHFNKKMLFGEIKTAVARLDNTYDVIDLASNTAIGTYNIQSKTFIPTVFDKGYTVLQNSLPSGTVIGNQTIKYEVVYAEIKDENTNQFGQGPSDIIDLSRVIKNPYYSNSGNAYVIATPNSFNNMSNAVAGKIGYQDKGVFPDWMTSVQKNDTQLGFVRAVVLAYTVPDAADTIAYRFKQLGFNLNEINFVADRYQLDNVYSTNYDFASNSFISSSKTTFDRYPALSSSFTAVASVDYAVSTAFQDINSHTVSEINTKIGGLDGIQTFKNGDTLVFFEQEFNFGLNLIDSYNQGWAYTFAPWDGEDYHNGDWDFNSIDGWDPASYVTGYKEWLTSKSNVNGQPIYNVTNQRAAIWRVTITNDFVTLSLANVKVSIKSVTANTAGYGSNVVVSSADGLYVGMSLQGSGLGNATVITGIVGSNITVFPAISGTVSTTWTAMPTINFNNAIFVKNGYVSAAEYT